MLRRIKKTTTPATRRGVALILVLGVLAALAWVVAAIVMESRHRIAEQTAFTRRGALRAAAWSACESAVAVIRERQLAEDGLHAVTSDPTPGMTEAGWLPPRGLDITVHAEDESGRYGLAAMDSDMLRDLLVDQGLPFDAASRLAERLLVAANPARRTNDRGTEYDDPNLPDHPAMDWLELSGVSGFADAFLDADGKPNDRFRDFRRCVSLAGDTRTPNLNGASLPMLRHLAKRGIIADAVALDKWLAGPDGTRGTADDRYARTQGDLVVAGAEAAGASPEISVLRVRITVTVTMGEGSYVLSVLCDPTMPTAGFPWKILGTRENRLDS